MDAVSEVMFGIQNLSEIGDGENLDNFNIEISVENSIKILSECINAEFNKNSPVKEELFSLPAMMNFGLQEKIQLARDLSDLLLNCKTKRNSIQITQNIDSLRNYRPSAQANRTSDLLLSILNQEAEGLYINPAQCEEILSILDHYSATSETNKLRIPLANCQKDFIAISQKVDQVHKTMRVKEDEHSFLQDSNKNLSETIQLLNKQIKALEKALNDSVIEGYVYEEYHKNLEAELKDATYTLNLLLEENSTNDKQGNTKKNESNKAEPFPFKVYQFDSSPSP